MAEPVSENQGRAQIAGSKLAQVSPDSFRKIQNSLIADNDKLAFQNRLLAAKLDEIQASFFFRLAENVIQSKFPVWALLKLPFTALKMRKAMSAPLFQARPTEDNEPLIEGRDPRRTETFRPQKISGIHAYSVPRIDSVVDAGVSYFDVGIPPKVWVDLVPTGLSARLTQNFAENIAIRLRLESREAVETSATVSLTYYNFAGELLKVGPAFQSDVAVSITSNSSIVFSLPLPNTCASLKLTIIPEARANIRVFNTIETTDLSAGISVILPTYKGEDYIETCLASLARQTLSRDQFEVIVVINGEADTTPQRVVAFAKRYPGINIRVIETPTGGAGRARNFGLRMARRVYTCFLDDDDTLAPEFLKAALALAAPDAVVVTSMIDHLNGEDVASSLNTQILSARNQPEVGYIDVSSALSTNAGKVAPTAWMNSIAFDETLRNGEDVVFWGQLVALFRPKILISAEGEGGEFTAYKRLIRDNSISRKAPTFQFMVEDRLDVIAALEANSLPLPQSAQAFLAKRIRAQLGFIERYLERNPQERAQVMNAIDQRNIVFPIKNKINEPFCEDLTISFCFPPFVDTAGVVAAKRITEAARPTDVICNAMFATRKVDERLLRLSDDWVGRLSMLNAPESFANWRAIAKFCELANAEITRREGSRGKYKRVYSRVLWPAANFAAALHKAHNSDVYWTAEFSDPVRKDIHGLDRDGELSRQWLEDNGILNAIADQGYAPPETNNLFSWCEFLAYFFADELIFTNPHQRNYMIGYIEDPAIKALVRRKATIKVQPTFNAKIYGLADTSYSIDSAVTNIGYFGAFYATRGIGVVLAQIARMSEIERAKILLHIFTNQTDVVEALPEYKVVQNSVILNRFVPYLEFLNLSQNFDYLLVNDAATIGAKPMNPYLPSKLSDYVGTGRKIWALYEAGSTMAALTEKTDIVRTDMNDEDAVLRALRSFYTYGTR